MDDLFDILRLLSLVVVVAAVASVVSVFVQEGLRIFFTSRNRVSTVTNHVGPLKIMGDMTQCQSCFRCWDTNDDYPPSCFRVRSTDPIEQANEFLTKREAE